MTRSMGEKMLKESGELQQRTCRSCQRTYEYPVPKSTATRFYCAQCMELDEKVRALFEVYNKRIKALTARVEKLEQGK